MDAGMILYKIGELSEKIIRKIIDACKDFFMPTPSESPPSFRLLKMLVKRKVTVHEMLVLKFQILFIVYLLSLFLILLVRLGLMIIFVVSIVYFLYLRYCFKKYHEYLLEPEAYQMFYYGISILTLVSFGGYELLREYLKMYYNVNMILIYVGFVFIVVMMFRFYFKSKYGRKWTYGVIEEIKENVVKISVHDDIRANVKPGEYWVDKVPDVEIGRIVKVLVEERPLRGAVPTKIIEVYLNDQSSSSKASTEAKGESEANSSL